MIKKGFTLIELMVVIAIMGIVAAFSLPMINSGQAKYTNSVNNLMDRMNVARQNALTTNTVTLFYLDSDSFKLGNQTYKLDKKIDIVGEKPIIGEELSFDSPIQFNPGGTSSDFVIMQVTGYGRSVDIIVTPSGYILKSELKSAE